MNKMEEVQSIVSHLIDKISAAQSNLCVLERCAKTDIIDGQALVGKLHQITVVQIISLAQTCLDAANLEIERLRTQLKSLQHD